VDVDVCMCLACVSMYEYNMYICVCVYAAYTSYWHLRTWFSGGHGSGKFTAGLDEIKGLFRPQ